MRDLHDLDRYELWMELARTILVEFYKVRSTPCSFGEGRAGNFLISLWQFIQENYYPDNAIPANYSFADSAPVTPIPQMFFIDARDLQLPLPVINNDNNYNDDEDFEMQVREEHLEEEVEEAVEEEAVAVEVDIEVAYEMGVNNLEDADENSVNNFEDAYEVGADNFPDAYVVGANNLPSLMPEEHELYIDLFNHR